MTPTPRKVDLRCCGVTFKTRATLREHLKSEAHRRISNIVNGQPQSPAEALLYVKDLGNVAQLVIKENDDLRLEVASLKVDLQNANLKIQNLEQQLRQDDAEVEGHEDVEEVKEVDEVDEVKDVKEEQQPKQTLLRRRAREPKVEKVKCEKVEKVKCGKVEKVKCEKVQKVKCEKVEKVKCEKVEKVKCEKVEKVKCEPEDFFP